MRSVKSVGGSGAMSIAQTYGVRELTTVCPWCIADGSAHEKFGVEFTDWASIGGGHWEAVSEEIANEVAFRTPGFSGWQ
jgi:uncharacterized protein CbrC (UPF0167 family)